VLQRFLRTSSGIKSIVNDRQKSPRLRSVISLRRSQRVQAKAAGHVAPIVAIRACKYPCRGHDAAFGDPMDATIGTDTQDPRASRPPLCAVRRGALSAGGAFSSSYLRTHLAFRQVCPRDIARPPPKCLCGAGRIRKGPFGYRQEVAVRAAALADPPTPPACSLWNHAPRALSIAAPHRESPEFRNVRWPVGRRRS
jgi:hypothetical protein